MWNGTGILAMITSECISFVARSNSWNLCPPQRKGSKKINVHAEVVAATHVSLAVRVWFPFLELQGVRYVYGVQAPSPKS